MDIYGYAKKHLELFDTGRAILNNFRGDDDLLNLTRQIVSMIQNEETMTIDDADDILYNFNQLDFIETNRAMFLSSYILLVYDFVIDYLNFRGELLYDSCFIHSTSPHFNGKCIICIHNEVESVRDMLD